MSTSALSGHTGSCSGGQEIKKWTCNLKTKSLDATSMASNGWEEYIEGLQGASGSFDCIGGLPDKGPTSLSLVTSEGGHTISGQALINDVAPTSQVDGVVTYTAQFVFSGEVSAS